MEVKSVHKRSLDHEDGDGNDAMIQPALENAYDHRIRYLINSTFISLHDERSNEHWLASAWRWPRMMAP
ncbi:hypothetical protein EVAR_28897_1 [Eumeta japonica]|uniref:Uncharacterized protein n=1 Tax=Eumeta variegata TaxID=151549 RepID=A0A4C1X1W7_EUMVA|nr:hypothetical protein EVAR_28897_1 [Eumeta japonica]